jgi:peptidoglycan/LPS O-acetylase OafA/YrhL
MASEPFITRRLSPWLDLIRATAAFAVLTGHAVQQGLYSGYWPFTIALQQNAVIIFFVLSGLVIASSVEQRTTRLADYVIARVTRILPVAFPALVISLLVAALGQGQGTSVAASAVSGTHSVWDGFLPAALFLSASYRTGLWINPPYWSLCYEVWFYAIFAAMTFLDGTKKLVCVLILAAIAGPNILLMMPIWWLGVWLARSTEARSVSSDQARIRIAIALTLMVMQQGMAEPLFHFLLTMTHWNLGYSHYALSYFILAMGVTLGITGLRKLVEDGHLKITRGEGAIRFAANMSFSLYLLHWPLIGFLRILHVSAGRNPLVFAGLLLLISSVCAIFAALVEHRRKQLRAFLTRRLIQDFGMTRRHNRTQSAIV